jgi:hypothetical protein
MPKTPTDFSRCIIYKIVCFDTNISDCYVGHTTDFIRRKSQHKSRYNNPNSKEYNKKVYQFIRSNGDWSNFQMLQIEEHPCSNKREAELREEHWRKELTATLNGNKAFITDEELSQYKKLYYEQNKGEIKIKYQQNKDQISQYKKLYYEQNKDEIKIKYQQNKDQISQYHKLYREQNKDKIRLQKQLYYQKNKARITEQVRNNQLKKKQIQNTE